MHVVHHFGNLCMVCARCARESGSLALFYACSPVKDAVGGCGIDAGCLVGA